MGVLDVSWGKDSNENQEDLFPIFEGAESRVRVPRSVRSFDITMRRTERDMEADYVFMVWLARKIAGGIFIDGSTQAIAKEEGHLAVCAHPEYVPIINEEMGKLDIDDFFAELPEIEDYAAGEEDPEYQEEYVNAAIRIINAKNACKGCPLRLKCLTDSILMGDEDKEHGYNSNVRPLPGIWGGRDIKDRKSVARKFKAIRNDYMSKTMPQEQRRRYERMASRFLDERP